MCLWVALGPWTPLEELVTLLGGCEGVRAVNTHLIAHCLDAFGMSVLGVLTVDKTANYYNSAPVLDRKSC